MSAAVGRGRTRAVSWQDVVDDVAALVRRLAEQPEPPSGWLGLVAVARGGLVPTALVARALRIRLVETVCLSTYRRRRREPLRIVKPAPARLGDGAGWLIVDDIADTGATAHAVRGMLPAARLAALYVKPAARPVVDAWVHEVDTDVWIEFPWEDVRGA